MMWLMDRNWTRLGEQLRAARLASEIRQNDIADQVGLKRGAVRNIELGHIARVTPAIRAYAQIVGWTPESIDRVLAGGDPTPAVASDSAGSTDARATAPPVQDAETQDFSVAVRT